jgi:hypothetical protein
MGWIVFGAIVFVCVFLLVARIYIAKGKKQDEASQAANRGVDEGADSESEE